MVKAIASKQAEDADAAVAAKVVRQEAAAAKVAEEAAAAKVARQEAAAAKVAEEATAARTVEEAAAASQEDPKEEAAHAAGQDVPKEEDADAAGQDVPKEEATDAVGQQVSVNVGQGVPVKEDGGLDVPDSVDLVDTEEQSPKLGDGESSEMRSPSLMLLIG